MSESEQALTPSAERVNANIETAKKLNGEIISLTKAARDSADKLGKEIRLGRKFVERCRFQKESTSDWNGRHYSAMIRDREEDVKQILGINDVRLDQSAKIAMFVDSVKVSHPLVEKVSYYRIQQFFIPHYEWSGVSLDGQIKDDWRDFIAQHIDDNAEGKDLPKPMSIERLRTLIDAHKAQLKAVEAAKSDTGTDKPNDKTHEAQEKERKKQERLAKAKEEKEKTAAREGFTAAYETVVKQGGYTAKELRDHFALAYDFAELDTPVEHAPFSPTKLNVKDAADMMHILYAAGKMAEIKAMVEAGQAMIKAFAQSAATVSEAG